jgi:hypothetical protein
MRPKLSHPTISVLWAVGAEQESQRYHHHFEHRRRGRDLQSVVKFHLQRALRVGRRLGYVGVASSSAVGRGKRGAERFSQWHGLFGLDQRRPWPGDDEVVGAVIGHSRGGVDANDSDRGWQMGLLGEVPALVRARASAGAVLVDGEIIAACCGSVGPNQSDQLQTIAGRPCSNFAANVRHHSLQKPVFVRRRWKCGAPPGAGFRRAPPDVVVGLARVAQTWGTGDRGRKGNHDVRTRAAPARIKTICRSATVGLGARSVRLAGWCRFSA